MTSALNPCDTESQPSVTHWPARHICLILFGRMVTPLPNSSILRTSWSPSSSNRPLNQGPPTSADVRCRQSVEQVDNGRLLPSGQRNTFSRQRVDVNMGEMTYGGRFFSLREDCEFVSERAVADAPDTDADVDRFGKSNRREELASAGDAKTDRGLSRSPKDTPFYCHRRQSRIKPTVVSRIVHMPVGVTVGPAA